jgi:hypothetical protein
VPNCPLVWFGAHVLCAEVGLQVLHFLPVTKGINHVLSVILLIAHLYVDNSFVSFEFGLQKVVAAQADPITSTYSQTATFLYVSYI